MTERHEVNAKVDIQKIRQYLLCIDAFVCKINDEMDTAVIRAGSENIERRNGDRREGLSK